MYAKLFLLRQRWMMPAIDEDAALPAIETLHDLSDAQQHAKAEIDAIRPIHRHLPSIQSLQYALLSASLTFSHLAVHIPTAILRTGEDEHESTAKQERQLVAEARG